MRERPILFAGAMVRAILDGRKTQTRRVVKIPGVMPRTAFTITSSAEEMIRFDDGTFHYLSTAALSGPYPCPYGQAGDRLWVRETWAASGSRTRYRADQSHPDDYPGAQFQPWRPSIHMPRVACRLVLEITDVRVERLQAISHEDALAEGVFDGAAFCDAFEPGKRNAAGESHEDIARRLQWPQRQFQRLWASINGQASWDANPWVWALTFRQVTP